jgi:hypothetical protein
MAGAVLTRDIDRMGRFLGLLDCMPENPLRSSAMTMSPERKRLLAVLFVLFLLMDVVLVVYFLQLARPKPSADTGASSQSQSQIRKEKTATPRNGGEASSSVQKTSELLDDLLAFASESGTKKTIIYGDSELIAVEGRSIVEDKATGKVVVRGLKRVEMSTGGVVESSEDGELTYDPATGKTDITASSVTFTSPPGR